MLLICYSKYAAVQYVNRNYFFISDTGNIIRTDSGLIVLTFSRIVCKNQFLLRQDFYGTSADAVSEGIDLCFTFKVYGNMIKETLDPKTKNNIETANTTWAGIAAANTLVKLAAENPTFPSKLNTKEVLTDLTNYITDGTIDNNPTNYAYSNVIRTWGALIFNNQESTMKGIMDFLPERKTVTTLTGPSGVQIPLIGLTGNSNPDVIKANDLIKDKKVQYSGTQVQSTN